MLIRRDIGDWRYTVLIVPRWRPTYNRVNRASMWLCHRLFQRREFMIMDEPFAEVMRWL